ncbi:LOW QUALITY PROTEIN: testis-specific serine/threonine-protein kinase 6 [Acanthochromis polyacanthus]|uniref:LOW QUALITY PROTEIN: testis-specific serine/threonine-protein kinase 6 n=1 Tax=Acanthochromis polyacanthus TaxID=80966 RepID=UPI00223448FC|nr:LOW QUALITY PROTEIN: testis-specific serine/threonine-protein kinase 6 [Acanthochromis polyacanthus]
MGRHGYALQGYLGEGGFGKVRAYSTHMKKSIVMKIIDRKNNSPSDRENFLSREKKIIRSVNHPNIIKTHHISESRLGTIYIVMELCKNGDLSNYISVQGALEESSSCRLFKQLCTALRYLHNMDVAHRDLKCENLLLDMHNNIKVCDFGSYVDGQMVLSETYCGTAAYAAPEILKRLPYNPKVSDVWSMGVVLYMMLYASLPFNDSNITRMVKEQMEHCINFPEIPPVSSEAKALIHRILHSVVENPLAAWQIC